MTDKTYIVLKAQQDGADSYKRGDDRTMPEADAMPLVNMGALKTKPAPKPKSPKKD